MRRFWVFGMSIVLLVSACADFPDLDDSLSDKARGAAFPVLIPVAPLIDQASEEFDDTARIAKQIIARARVLRRKARALRGPVIDARTKAVLRRASRRHKRLTQL